MKLKAEHAQLLTFHIQTRRRCFFVVFEKRAESPTIEAKNRHALHLGNCDARVWRQYSGGWHMKPSIFGAILVAALLFADTGSAMAARKWLEFRSDNFIVYSQANEKRTFQLVEDLEFFRHYLQILTPTGDTSAPLPLKIYAFRNLYSFQKELNTGAAGFYLDRPSGAQAFASLDKPSKSLAFTSLYKDQEKQSLTGRHILFHEYVHYFLRQFNPYRYPSWYDEGFAEFLASFSREGRDISVGLPARYRTPALNYFSWLPMKKLLSANRRTLPKGIFYGQSWISVHYLQTVDKRNSQLNRYILALNLGLPYEEAFELTFDISMKELGREIRSYWASGALPYTIFSLSEFDYSPEITVRQLDQTETLLMLANIHVDWAHEKWHYKKAMGYISKLLKRDSSSIAVKALQIEANLARGHYTETAEMLNQLSQAERSDARMLLLEGRLHMALALGEDEKDEDGNEEEDEEEETEPVVDQAEIIIALKAFRASLRLNPKSPETLYHYGKSVTLSDDGDPRLAIGVLTKARALLPQNREMERTYAEAALKAGYNKEAAEIFQDYLNWSASETTLKWARRNLKATGVEPSTLFNNRASDKDAPEADR